MQVFRKILLKSERFPVHKCMVEYFVEEEKNIPQSRGRTATLPLPLILHRDLTLCGKSFRSLVDPTYLWHLARNRSELNTNTDRIMKALR
jgi:hypothetical protein